MASDQERNPLVHNLGIAAVLMLTASAIVVKHIRLEGSRPPSESAAPLRPASEQDVEARLWQDPIGAVTRYRDAQKASGPNDVDRTQAHSAQTLGDKIRQTLERQDVVIVGAMVRGGPYFEDSESRRRLRYAVVSALRVTNYVPESAESIGYFDYSTEPNLARSRNSFIAFEWFGRDRLRKAGTSSAKDRKVLMLWMEDGEFQTKPLAKLDSLLVALGLSQTTAQKPVGKVVVKILGPRGTSGLQGLIREVDASAHPESISRGPEIEFLSYSATADDEYFRKWTNHIHDGETIEAYLNRRHVKFLQTIGTDNDLADSIQRELVGRGVNLREHYLTSQGGGVQAALKHDKNANASAEVVEKSSCDRLAPPRFSDHPSPSLAPRPTSQPHPHLVLIGESDTAYARALPQAFLHNIGLECGRWIERRKDYETPHWIHAFSYLRGLDGQVADSSRSRTAPEVGTRSSDSKSKKDAAEDAARIERPEGQGQIDYLRRLAEKIKKLDAAAAAHDGKIRAVGIIGSDVYDKLLILQALKPALPDAIFFTTDLDTRLLHPADRAWTRNLLVASSFGLELTAGLQRDLPPFRDSYQTSVFLATQIAMRNASVELQGTNGKRRPITSDKARKWTRSPRLYEVGREGLFELTTGDASDDAQRTEDGTSETATKADCRELTTPECVSIHPRPDPHPNMAPKTGNLLSLGIGAVAVGYIAARSQLRRRIIRATLRALCFPLLPFTRLRVRVGWKLRRAVASGGRRYPCLFLLLGAIPSIVLLAVAAYLGSRFADAWNAVSSRLEENGYGEPLDLLGGVSIWPTESLRIVATLMALYFLFSGWRKLDDNRDKLVEQFAFRHHQNRLASIGRNGKSVWAKINHTLYRLIAAFSYDLNDLRNDPRIKALRLQREGAVFWLKYLYQGSVGARLLRVSVVTTLVWILTFFVAHKFIPLPAVPYRGELAGRIDFWIEGAATAAVLFLCFAVADAILLCHNFAKELRKIDHAWPSETLHKFSQRFKTSPRYLDDWIDLKVLEERTITVARLVYYPFIVLSLLILARSPLFDNWVNPPAVYFAPGIGLVVIIGCAILLRRAVERSRSAAVTRVTEWLMAAKAMGETGKTRAEQLTMLQREIEGLRRGAFAPYTQQPMIKALMIPLSAMSGTALLDYVVLANV